MKRTEGRYLPSERREFAVKHALDQMTSAVLGSAATTLGSSFFLFFCKMGIFVKLAAVLFAVTVFAEIFALCGLPAALLVFGPRGAFGCFGLIPEDCSCCGCWSSYFGGGEELEGQTRSEAEDGYHDQEYHDQEPQTPKSVDSRSEVFISTPKAAHFTHATAPQVFSGIDKSSTAEPPMPMLAPEHFFTPSRPRGAGASTVGAKSRIGMNPMTQEPGTPRSRLPRVE
mmetsp:Transcript_32534/g.60667  ORF Transcript_32534/g.60667 Transcript_32534/m.60667 type:complete len:227 (-) Transcript_32534:21-701(-)